MDDDRLDPARGIVIGLGISFGLWIYIGSLILWLHG